MMRMKQTLKLGLFYAWFHDNVQHLAERYFVPLNYQPYNLDQKVRNYQYIIEEYHLIIRSFLLSSVPWIANKIILLLGLSDDLAI